MGRLSLDIRELVIQKLKQGWSQRKVAKELNISRNAVQYIILKLKRHNTLEDLFKSGRRPKNTKRSERSLIRMSKENPQKTASRLLIDWKSSQTSSVSTVKRILRKYGLFGRIAAKKPLLNE